VRYPQVKRLRDLDAFRARLVEVGATLPVDEHVDPDGVLASPVEITDGSAGTLRIPNRFAVLPMEGWDGTDDGRPTELVRRRWARFGQSGCGLVWGEATAVRADGRANPRQLILDERTVDDLAALRRLLSDDQVVGIQLTHSGRYARPDGVARPRTAYRHPVLDDRVGADAASVLSDDELDVLAEDYVRAAVHARDAGFAFVDIKHCHGYLLHELLSARDRPGRYGGDLRGRTHFLTTVVEGIRRRAPGLAVAVRVSLFDLRPHTEGPDGVGVPDGSGPYPFAFGGDGSGGGIDLTETHAFLDLVYALGVGLVATSAGSPYYNPHIQRPAYFPPSDGYQPPEDPLVGVDRLVGATAEVAERHPGISFVGAGYSYLQEWLPHVAQAVVGRGSVAMVGLGRVVLSYPDLAADVLAGRALDARRVCRTFSDCTTAPRHGMVSGCYPLDGFYRERAERVELAQVKRDARARHTGSEAPDVG
jgi:2,4-dienoyl-CoA reductase-like NADH-dependent reductase (Old Yellow Enzyme family)